MDLRSAGPGVYKPDSISAINKALTQTVASSNDVDTAAVTGNVGADGSLGPAAYMLGVHPSATGTNRFGFIGFYDGLTGTMRPFVLGYAGQFSRVLIGSKVDNGVDALQVTGSLNVTTTIHVGSGTSVAQALCVNSSSLLSYCTSVVGSSGGCTCH